MEHLIYHCPRLQKPRDEHPIIRNLLKVDLPKQFKLGFVCEPPLGVQDLFKPTRRNEEVLCHTGLNDFALAVGFKTNQLDIAKEELQAIKFIDLIMKRWDRNLSRGLRPPPATALLVGSGLLAAACGAWRSQRGLVKERRRKREQQEERKTKKE
jgi:hypothetical protein